MKGDTMIAPTQPDSALQAFLDELTKVAKLKSMVKLRPHQEEVVDFVVDNDGRALLAHGTGSGKTLSSIASIEKLRSMKKAKKTLVALPASLKTNFAEQGVKKFTNRTVGEVGSGADYQLVSMEKFRRDPVGTLEASGADSLIIDEVHRAKDPKSETYKAYKAVAPKVKNLLGLTGSFVSNHPKDVVPLMDIVKPGHGLGRQPTFTKRYTKRKAVKGGGFLKMKRKERVTLKNKEQLHGRVKGKLHYLGHDELGDLPGLDVKNVFVRMTPEQRKHYDFALGKLTSRQRRLIREGLPVSQTEAMTMLPRLLRARQASNSVGIHAKMTPVEAAESTPKLKKVMDDIQSHLKETKDGQAIAYSNFMEGGARELYEGLKARGVPTGLYSGSNKDTRDRDVKAFRKRRKKAIVLTPAGGEGISLDNATFFAEVDRHYNPERNQQAIARGRRLGGQAHRKPEDRVLEVKRYHSDPPTPWYRRLLGFGTVGVDEWVGNVAKEKDILNEEMRDVTRGRLQ